VLRLRIEKLFRDAKFTHIHEGTNQIQKIVVANQLLHTRRLWTMIRHPT
jgi:alkylation response protein AidB-like acyl-CoA dehydrogenase